MCFWQKADVGLRPAQQNDEAIPNRSDSSHGRLAWIVGYSHPIRVTSGLSVMHQQSEHEPELTGHAANERRGMRVSCWKLISADE